jgi:acetoacetyl-CoA synthetase
MTQAPDALDVPQWRPSQRDIADARVTDFARFVQQRTGAPMADYHSLWQWSVDDPAAFWGALWDYFELGAPPDRVLDQAEMPGARWFPGVRLNYVDQIMRNARSDRPAILHVSEDGQVTELSWHELLRRTAAFAQTLRSLGVTAGDRVVGYLSSIPRRSSRSWRPRASARSGAHVGGLFAKARWTGSASSNRWSGHRRRLSVRRQVHDKRGDVAALQASLPTLRATVLASELTAEADAYDLETVPSISTIRCGFCSRRAPPGCRRDHPRHGGVVLEHESHCTASRYRR